MDDATLLRTLSQPLHDVDPDELRQALIERGICTPPEPAGNACDDWFDSWPVECVEAAQRFMAAGPSFGLSGRRFVGS